MFDPLCNHRQTALRRSLSSSGVFE